jgi:sulfur-oxidizing protein SoxX
MVRQHYRRNVWLTNVWLTIAAASMVMPLSALEIQARAASDRPLTGRAGDVLRGRAIAADARKGNCIICHAMPIPGLSADAFGDIGPSLAGVGSRRSVPALRQRIVDPRVLSPDTVMPAYFATTRLTRVQAAYVGKTILSAQEVEDLVAYLASLK